MGAIIHVHDDFAEGIARDVEATHTNQPAIHRGAGDEKGKPAIDGAEVRRDIGLRNNITGQHRAPAGTHEPDASRIHDIENVG